MDNETKTWLYDILKSTDEIESYFEGKPKVFTDYQRDFKTKRAVERNIEIIGEAMNRILKRDPDFRIENAIPRIGSLSPSPVVSPHTMRKKGLSIKGFNAA